MQATTGSNVVFENNLCWNIYADAADEYAGNVYFTNIDGLEINNNTVIGRLTIDQGNNVEMYNNIVGYISLVDPNNVSNDYNIINHGTIDAPLAIGANSDFNYPGQSWDKWDDPLFTDLFADYDNGDYTLAAGSTAIGFGNTTYATTTDILGITRGAPPDAGAYEYVAPPSTGPSPGQKGWFWTW